MPEISNILVKNCRRKISAYKQTDDQKIRKRHPEVNENLVTLNIVDALTLIAILDSDQCVGCGCEMIFTGYLNGCLNQFSFDRIDNSKIHCADNLRIVCLGCNINHNIGPNGVSYNRIKCCCPKGCHLQEGVTREMYERYYKHRV